MIMGLTGYIKRGHLARAVLEATSRAIVRCGRVGDAATLKVATNLLTAVTTQTLAEALAIVRGVGISPEAFAAHSRTSRVGFFFCAPSWPGRP